MSSKRSHRKSRLGCKQCKSRRIKCDETPPCCGNCAKRGLECEYEDYKDAFQKIQLLTPDNFPNASASGSATPGRNTPEPPLPAQAFSLDDMGLLHHFTLHTSQTLGPIDNEQYRHIWQHEVPRLAQSNPFLMHAILSFAAVHRASLQGDTGPQDQNVARQHYSQAINLFRKSVNEVTTEKADAILCFSILVGLLAVCLESGKDSDEQDPIGDFVGLVHVLHRAIGVMKLVRDSLSTSAIGRLLSHTWNKQPHPIPPDVSLALDQLDSLALSYSSAAPEQIESKAIKDAAFKLRQYYSVVRTRPDTWAYVLAWPISVTPEFATLLQQRDPLALCILAHWCVPPYHAPVMWFTGNWPRRLILAISQQLHESDWREGIRWPLRETIDESHWGDV